MVTNWRWSLTRGAQKGRFDCINYYYLIYNNTNNFKKRVDRGGGDSLMKGVGMFVVSLTSRGVNFRGLIQNLQLVSPPLSYESLPGGCTPPL